MSEINWEERFKALVREVGEISQGIHPAAWAGKYEKRTERMEGWNDAVMDCMTKISSAVERVSADVTANEDYDLLAKSGLCFFDEGVLSINLNDAMFWAMSDREVIPADKVEEVAGLFRKWGWAGLLYWVTKQRGWTSADVEFKNIRRFIDFVKREEELCKTEPDSNKRAYMDIPEKA